MGFLPMFAAAKVSKNGPEMIRGRYVLTPMHLPRHDEPFKAEILLWSRNAGIEISTLYLERPLPDEEARLWYLLNTADASGEPHASLFVKGNEFHATVERLQEWASDLMGDKGLLTPLAYLDVVRYEAALYEAFPAIRRDVYQKALLDRWNAARKAKAELDLLEAQVLA